MKDKVQRISSRKFIWGFIQENVIFTNFEKDNQSILEAALVKRQKLVVITDKNLPKPHKASVYFGVDKMHLRMPGTRYNVKRKVLVEVPSVSPRSVPSVSPRSVSSVSPCSVPTTCLLTPQNMASPMSTASISTTTTSTCASSDYLQTPLDPTFAALIYGNMVFPDSNGNTFSYSPSSYDQFLMPIENRNNNGVQTTIDTIKNNGNSKHAKSSSQNFVDNYQNINQTDYLGHNMQYVDNTQYTQQQFLVPMNSISDYSLPAPIVTDSGNLLPYINWLCDDSLYTQPSNFNNDTSLQEVVSWPIIDSSFVPNFYNGDY